MRTRPHILGTLVAAACLFLLTACGKPGGGGGGEKVYVVATDNGFVPFEFVDEKTGELTGFDIDLVKAVAARAGLKIRFQTLDFDGIIAGMQAARFDMGIAGITITAKRDETIDFSDPYYDAGLIVAVRSGETSIRSAADLGGKRVGTRTGTTSEAYLAKHHPDAEVVAFPGIVEAYMELRAGRVSAVLYDVPNVRYYARTQAGGDLKAVGEVLQGEQYGIAFPQGSPLKAKVDAALAALRKDGTYGAIHEKWFGTRPGASKG